VKYANREIGVPRSEFRDRLNIKRALRLSGAPFFFCRAVSAVWLEQELQAELEDAA